MLHLHPIYCLSPAPSPNGEGSERYHLLTKRASLHIEETPFSHQRNALLDMRRAFL
ncbi:hypothetical protein HMPREF0973_01126 [Prevotella veroralis F0319]|uniref:Uncharacterized protein n=1 Tax=Prevotella veroralis F0319 TaxID=649761 RepID=C9MND9_9BACT|nr:hypothetical protein HMPREF0973_01126 [Prevotella veroralis F0319]